MIKKQADNWEHFLAEQAKTAKLIAAAPDLLEACQRLLNVIDIEHEACGIYKAHRELAKAAIAKATE